MGVDEQKEEREVLDSIFPDEITDVSETEFRVSVVLDVPTSDEEDAPESPTLVLQIQYPPNYPDEAPRLDLSAPPNAPKHPHLDIQEDKSRLLDGLNETIEENLGMAMIFTLISTLKDLAEALIAERVKSVQALKDFEAAKAEEAENLKFQGTQVNRETFLEWREGFFKEMKEEEERRRLELEAEEKKKRGGKDEKKMTGRELWEKGLAGKTDDDEEDEGGLEGMQTLKVAG